MDRRALQLGQQEMAVRLFWPELDPRDQEIRLLLNFLGNYIAEQPKRILGGQTLRYGLTMLRFVADERNESGLGTDRLLVEELASPFTSTSQSIFRARAARLPSWRFRTLPSGAMAWLGVRSILTARNMPSCARV